MNNKQQRKEEENNGEFLIYSCLKALCKNYHMRDNKKRKQEIISAKQKSIFVSSFLQLFFFIFCEWPVADDKRMFAIYIFSVVWLQLKVRRENYNIRQWLEAFPETRNCSLLMVNIIIRFNIIEFWFVISSMAADNTWPYSFKLSGEICKFREHSSL